MPKSAVAIASLIFGLMTFALITTLAVIVYLPAPHAENKPTPKPTPPNPGPNPGPTPQPQPTPTPTPTPGTDSDIKYSLAGVNKRFKGPGHAQTTYFVLPLGKFVAERKLFILEGGATRLEIREGGGNHDQAKLKLFLCEGDVQGSVNFDSAPPQNKIIAQQEMQATRSHDAILSTLLFACLRAGTTYTIGVLMTFEEGTGTDDTVVLTMDNVLSVTTTSNDNTMTFWKAMLPGGTMCP